MECEMRTGIWAKNTWKSISVKDFAGTICVCVERSAMYKIMKMGVIEPQSGSLMLYLTSAQLITQKCSLLQLDTCCRLSLMHTVSTLMFGMSHV